MKDLFTKDEKARIQEAVAKAELQTAGEIVPYIVARSGRYEVALWRGAGLGVLLALFVVVLLFLFYQGWGLGWLYQGWGTALITVVAGLLGAALTAWFDPLKRGLVGPETLRRRVHERSIRAFVEEEVFNTRDRTGILLFISLFEHRIEVLGDEGINKKVETGEWIEVVDRIREGIVTDRLAEGLVEAIRMCGELLHRRGVGIRPDDEDELPNEVRLRDE